ncbi:hypothetical protein [Mailhella sp.]|uniref:hypothetical protein n=1 Tax=Mailhella sp. TaxID=1981029 RepID=UPI003AB75579
MNNLFTTNGSPNHHGHPRAAWKELAASLLPRGDVSAFVCLDQKPVEASDAERWNRLPRNAVRFGASS